MNEWDRSVQERTQNFVYQDSTVWLEIEKTKFRVSRHRLTSVSPLFETIFGLPKDEDPEAPIVLHHRLDEFENFLWYLHVDHLEYENYKTKCPDDEQFRRALGIASMAHFYQAMDIARWAIGQLLLLLPSSNITAADTLKRIHSFSLRARDLEPQLSQKVREYWCNQVRSSQDPVVWLRASQDAADEYLQAYAYYHILKLKNVTIRTDARLSALDKLRLHVGVFNLLRYQGVGCTCASAQVLQTGHLCGRTVDPDEWSPTSSVPLKESYGAWSLWDMFTRSPMGLVLTDQSELAAELVEGCNKANPAEKAEPSV
ncbi:hypothetical protein BKA62DRAFT_701784 [Auriculariales sp. MPI-PUGE-AT-0066]|nr:hypothetical protein BKA62DRAFT_701784 [Auriculariales sp. MPI-PUGE-AT-0066]